MKMQGLILLIFAVLVPCKIFSQNLVSNPSFESYNTCPTTTSQIFYANFWFQPNVPFMTWQQPSGSSDYYNICDTSTLHIAGVPANWMGFQFPRTANAYAGIAFINNPGGGWEYLEVGLTDSLKAKKKYCGGYYISRGSNGRNACNKQGIYFDVDSVFYYSPSYQPLIRNPQIENQFVIIDTSNWVLVKGAFIAQGGERFMLIGNFRDLISTTVDTIGSSGFFTSYYFIDDVFVEEMLIDTANAGGDKVVCADSSTQIGMQPCNGCIYTWQPATGLSDTAIAQPVASPTQTITYILTVRDTITGTLCDWTSTDTVTVFVDPPCPPPPPPEQPIEIYNIFTPNNDLKNDVFYIKNLPANSSLQIFNRWGSRVYQSSNYNNQWNGGGVPDGTYYYILVVPNKENYHGFVEIRR